MPRTRAPATDWGVFYRSLAAVALALLGFALACRTADAQAPKHVDARRTHAQFVDEVNANTVTIVSGGINGTYVRIAADFASVLDDGDALRVLPILGRGSLQNIKDILFLRGVDLGLVQSDVLESVKAEGKIPNVGSQVAYVARLYNEEIHILAPKDITDIRQLAGLKVNTDVAGSGTAGTAKVVFDRLGIAPEIVNFDQGVALEKLKLGEISATVYVSGKPVRGFSDFKSDGRFHLLGIPFDQRVQDIYFPTTMTEKDYPNLIGSGETVDTIAVGTILAVFDWPPGSVRYQRLAHFVDAFFSKFDEFLKPPRHPKWQEVNLAANVPGWTRFAPARDWLEHAAQANGSIGPTGDLPTDAAQQFADFQQFLTERHIAPAGNVTSARQEAIFKEFLEWNRSRKK
jgi:TRAP transporter TAXI family solute receptor